MVIVAKINDRENFLSGANYMNNEVSEALIADDNIITIINDRLEVVMPHQQFNFFI